MKNYTGRIFYGNLFTQKVGKRNVCRRDADFDRFDIDAAAVCYRAYRFDLEFLAVHFCRHGCFKNYHCLEREGIWRWYLVHFFGVVVICVDQSGIRTRFQ